MSGPFYGKVECRSNTGTQYTNAQEVFKAVYDFFTFLESQNVVTIITRWNGDGAGTGTDYHDGGAPFKTHAFFVVEWRTASTSPANGSYAGPRTQPFYTLVQFARSDQGAAYNSGTNGLPASIFGVIQGTGLSSGSGVVGIQMAVGVGGDFNPWNGTINLGAAAKGDPVWKNPASGGTGRFVFPRSNQPLAVVGTGASTPSHVTSQQNQVQLFYRAFDGTAVRYHMVADYDGFSFHWDYNNSLYAFNYHGIYTPRAGLTPTYPYVMLQGQGALGMGTGNIYGDYAGTNSTIQGGIAVETYGTDVRGIILGRIDEVLSTTAQPNRWFSPATYDEMPILMGPYDYHGGLAGSLPWIREVANIANLDTSSDARKIVLGNTATVSTPKIIVPWNNTVTHGSGVTREGTTGAFP